MSATIAEVASKAGVSLATASRGVNGKRGIKPETRERVPAAARALRYAANGAARGLITEPGSPAVATLLATELVVRGSCGCKPAPAASPTS